MLSIWSDMFFLIWKLDFQIMEISIFKKCILFSVSFYFLESWSHEVSHKKQIITRDVSHDDIHVLFGYRRRYLFD